VNALEQWHIRSYAADFRIDTDNFLFDRRRVGEALIGKPPQQRQWHGVRMYVKCWRLLYHAPTTSV
jgi:hypothetical protein